MNQRDGSSGPPGKKGKKNNLFKEVIVEDEAEDLRGSGMLPAEQHTLPGNNFGIQYSMGSSAMGTMSKNN